MSKRRELQRYPGPAGGWGSVKSLLRSMSRERVPLKGPSVLLKQNKRHGFACVSCAWAKPDPARPFEFCENGAKATTAEITSKRVTPAFFAAHTLAELEGWSDRELEAQGRLTMPLRWDRKSDRYLPLSWEDAFRDIGRELRQIDPKNAVFYASGRASLEATYMYQLFARIYGSNNLPDSSNMCHESTSVALPETIGVPVGTVHLDDFASTDFIFFFGQNVGSNSPRMLHQLQDASRRGVPIITFNPLRERGLERFINPQSPVEMLSLKETPISSRYHQVKAGGDIAALAGICKALLFLDDAARKVGEPPLIDQEFIDTHTHGFEDFADWLRQLDWAQLEAHAGLSRKALQETAFFYAGSRATIAVYGMGLTQHRAGVENVQMVSNLLLMRGNIGRPGAGICPVRGHSNVQGQRTVGMTEKPELAPLDLLERQFHFKAPRWTGLSTIDACKGMVDGNVRAFVSLGGNFLRAIPDHQVMEQAWRGLRLSVQIATKLNRSQVVHGEVAFILPCLGRIEIDMQAGGHQTVTMEDSTGCFHASHGQVRPASRQLLSEHAIVGGLALATLESRGNVPWAEWVGDYRLVRDAIGISYPSIFADFNQRIAGDQTFARPNAARQRVWKTKTGKANFVVPKSLEEDRDMPASGGDVLRLITLRSNGQFNTTVYSDNDRFRGIFGARNVLLMNPSDMESRGLAENDFVRVETVTTEPKPRRLDHLRIVAYDIPVGCCASYYPESNVLIPLWHHAERSKVPAAKSIPVRVFLMAETISPRAKMHQRVAETTDPERD